MEQPLVSIIIPVYNAEKHLKNLIQLFWNQSYNNWELILVDDISDDNSYGVLSEFAEIDNRIILLKREREPKGSTVCRNLGLNIAKGKYLINIDADDYISEFFLKNRVEFMEKNPYCDYATFLGVSAIQKNQELEISNRIWGQQLSNDILADFLSVNYPFSVWNNIYRMSKFKNMLWDEKVYIYTDFSYIIPVILGDYNHSFAKSTEFDYFYIQNNSFSMAKDFVSSIKANSTIYLFDKTLTSLAEIENYEKYKLCFTNFIYLHFKRLVMGGNNTQILNFITLVSKYYSRFYVLRMKIVAQLSRFLKNKKIKKIFLVVFLKPNKIKRIYNKITPQKQE